MPELILALDVGTTTARAAVVAPDGRILGSAAAALRTLVPAPGRAEQDAQSLWRTVLRLMRAALAQARRPATDLAAIGLTTQRASAVAWDRRSGRAVSALVLWSDERGAARAAELQEIGFLVAPQQAAAKLEALLAGSGREAVDLAWGNIDSWLIWNLTGGAVHASDRSQAWPSGYLRLSDLAWNSDIIAFQGLEDLAFPALVDTWGTIGASHPRWLGAAVPITADVADQQAALIAHGERPGLAKMTWGTSGTFDTVTDGLVFAGLPGLPPLIVASVAGRTTFCLEGMILSAGAAVDWARRVFALGAPARLAELAGRTPRADGVAFLPALQGLGAPHGEPQRSGRLVGLRNSVDRDQVARAVLEGLAFRAREILERAQAIGALAPDAPIGVDGGLTRAEPFLQILADLLGRSIRPLATPEATLMGAALLAARGAGLETEADVRAALAPVRTYEPAVSSDESASRFAAWSGAVHGA